MWTIYGHNLGPRLKVRPVHVVKLDKSEAFEQSRKRRLQELRNQIVCSQLIDFSSLIYTPVLERSTVRYFYVHADATVASLPDVTKLPPRRDEVVSFEEPPKSDPISETIHGTYGAVEAGRLSV